MKALNQLKTFQRILGDYPAETPLSKFLPGFYRQNKQMGSTDRKVASRLIYNYFRLGKALFNTPLRIDSSSPSFCATAKLIHFCSISGPNGHYV